MTTARSNLVGAIMTRDVRHGGGLPGHQELAEDMQRAGFDPSQYPAEIQAGLRQARARGMARSPQEAALFAIAFTEGARGAEPEGRTAAAAQARQGAERRVAAYRAALEAVRGVAYVPESAREDVARIMAQRDLSVSAAWDAWVAEGPASPRVGSRHGSVAR